MSITNNDLKWLAVDLDNFLAETSPHPEYKLLGAKQGAVDFCKKLDADGWKITIHTARPSSDYEAIEKWLFFYGIPYRRIYTGKILAKFYLDDRNVPYGSFDDMYNFVKNNA